MKRLSKTIALSTLSSLLIASAAHASFSFDVESFDEDELVVTISGSSALSGTAPSFGADLFFFADTDGSSSFFTGAPTGASNPVSPTLSISGATIGSVGSVDSVGDVLFFALDAPAVSGDSFVSDVELTFSGLNLFDFSEVGGELGLYWGISGSPAMPALLQDSAVVPENSSYSLLFGLFALGAVVTNRRAVRSV